jgi:hypothetical protein
LSASANGSKGQILVPRMPQVMFMGCVLFVMPKRPTPLYRLFELSFVNALKYKHLYMLKSTLKWLKYTATQWLKLMKCMQW